MNTTCCIAGGGPAGMMLGWLLARQGVDVVVLEKHGDFFRDFRGDTVHPSTLELMRELGVLDAFLKLPHSELRRLSLDIMGERVPGPDLSTLPTHCKFVAMMPQWDFLNFVRAQASALPGFHLELGAEVSDLFDGGVWLKDGRRITARLVVGADGRHSTVRARAGLKVIDRGAPIDVLWFRISRRPEDGDQVFAIMEPDRFMVMLDRGDYWQCAWLVEKGGYDRLRAAGLDAFRAELPIRGDELRTWDDVKLLTVVVDRLETWHRPGLLCIGDAAHAMSPVGGVGINLAIQDAVAAANLLGPALASGAPLDLSAVQARREPAAIKTQRLQLLVHDHILAKIVRGEGERSLRAMRFAFKHAGPLRHYVARKIGIGYRPEHVQS